MRVTANERDMVGEQAYFQREREREREYWYYSYSVLLSFIDNVHLTECCMIILLLIILFLF